jgi:hypothetical protein
MFPVIAFSQQATIQQILTMLFDWAHSSSQPTNTPFSSQDMPCPC